MNEITESSWHMITHEDSQESTYLGGFTL